jgi:hypothetical protein
MIISKQERHFVWTGQVNFNSNGNFNADSVKLSNLKPHRTSLPFGQDYMT